MLTRTGNQVTMASNGRSTGWNFTPAEFNFFASSCPKKRDRASRKDWISSLSAMRDEGTVVGVGGRGRKRQCCSRRHENRTAGCSGVNCARGWVGGEGNISYTNGRGLFSLKERKMRIPCAEAELLNIKVSEFRGASKVHSKT